MRLADVADVDDSVEDLRTAGLANGKPAVLVIIFRQPGANIIETVDRVRAAAAAAARRRSRRRSTCAWCSTAPPPIRASLARRRDARSLISIALVILVVFVFLRNLRATLIPSVAVPLSLIGTFGVMYLLGYSLDNLSLMALTISTGFVVDDAIVVHREHHPPPRARHARRCEAALRGAREIGFTVLSMSMSLVAVFIPILLMGGIVGRLFREFAVTLSVAIAISLVVSLTTTPDDVRASSCAPTRTAATARLYRAAERALRRGSCGGYERTPRAGCCATPRLTLLVAVAHRLRSTSTSTSIVPKGFFPQQDTGRLDRAASRPPRTTSFQAHAGEARAVRRRSCGPIPRSTRVVGFTGGAQGATNTGAHVRRARSRSDERKVSADEVIARLRPKLATVPGASLFLQAGAGPPRRRPPEQRRSTSTRSRATTSTSSNDWAPQAARASCSTMPEPDRRQQRPAEPRPARRRWSIDRDTRRAARRHAAA